MSGVYLGEERVGEQPFFFILNSCYALGVELVSQRNAKGPRAGFEISRSFFRKG